MEKKGILIVDDDKIHWDICEYAFSHYPDIFVLDFTQSNLGAQKKCLESFNNGKVFDLIILDMAIYEDDNSTSDVIEAGEGFIEWIEKEKMNGKYMNTKVLIFSGRISIEKIEYYKQKGYLVLIRPERIKQLFDVCAEILGLSLRLPREIDL